MAQAKRPLLLLALAGALSLTLPLDVSAQRTPVPETSATESENKLAKSSPTLASSATSATSVNRVITLAELGFADGIDMRGLTGVRELFFPVPSASDVGAMRLTLPYRSGAAFESRRALQIDIGGRPIFTTALAKDNPNGLIDIPVDPALIRNGFLPVTMRYSGAITEDRCVDQRASGAFIAFAPKGGVTASVNREALGNVSRLARVFPAASDIMLPANPNAAQSAAALILAADNTDNRILFGRPEPAATDWTRGQILISGPKAPALRANGQATQPTISIGGRDPDAAARLLQGKWRPLTNSATIGSAGALYNQRDRDELRFADLPGDISMQQIAERGSWSIALPMTALPAGKMPSAIVVDVAIGDDGSANPPVVSVLMNGLLLGSVEVEDSERTRLSLDLPEGLVAANNALEISVTRQVRAGDCAYAPQAYPAQLLPSSHIVLRNAGPPVDFGDLAPAFADGVTVVMGSSKMLPAVSRLIGPLVDGSSPIKVSYGKIPQNGPYILVSNKPPAGTDPSVRLDRGDVRLVAGEQEDLIEANAVKDFTIVQLLSDDSRPILWIKPGTEFENVGLASNGAALDRGDVAFFDSKGLELAFSTQRDRLIDIRYASQAGFGVLIKRNWFWVVGIGWLILSIGFIALLRGMYRSRKVGGSA